MRQAESLFLHQGSSLCPLHQKHRVREFLNLTFIILLPVYIRWENGENCRKKIQNHLGILEMNQVRFESSWA